jgi:hypothetical protein
LIYKSSKNTLFIIIQNYIQFIRRTTYNLFAELHTIYTQNYIQFIRRTTYNLYAELHTIYSQNYIIILFFRKIRYKHSQLPLLLYFVTCLHCCHRNHTITHSEDPLVKRLLLAKGSVVSTSSTSKMIANTD